MSATGPASTRCEPGAPQAAGVIPLSVPKLGGNEWAYVKECLDTEWVSSVGPFVDRFEEMTAAAIGTRHAVAMCSGTAALHVALLAAGVQPDDEVLVSTLTFIAPANAVRYAGAHPVFMDAEPEHWQMDARKVVDFLHKECLWHRGTLINKATRRRVRAVLPVHVLGHPVDLDPILEAARKYNLTVIEDAAESLGAKYKGRTVGHLGDIGCLSFNGNKTITTGGGGMLVTDNEAWARRAKYLSTQAKDDPLEYVHHEVGYNYRLTNLQAALGCAQMEKLSAHIEAKRQIAQRYVEGLAGVPGLTLMREAGGVFSTYWLYTVLVDERAYGESSRSLLRRLAGERIQTRPLWEPMHRSKAHAGAQAYRIEVADQLHAQALSLPCSVGLTPADQEQVIETVKLRR